MRSRDALITGAGSFLPPGLEGSIVSAISFTHSELCQWNGNQSKINSRSPSAPMAGIFVLQSLHFAIAVLTRLNALQSLQDALFTIENPPNSVGCNALCSRQTRRVPPVDEAQEPCDQNSLVEPLHVDEALRIRWPRSTRLMT